MKKETAYKIGLIVVAILLLIVTGLFFFKTLEIKSINKTVQTQSAELTKYKNTVTTFVNENNKLINSVQEINIEKRNAKAALTAAGIQIDSLKEVGIKANRLISFLRAELTVSNQGQGTVIYIDTLKTDDKPNIEKKINLKYDDGILKLNPITSYILKDDIFLDYKTITRVDVAELWDRDWFLGKKTISLSITSPDNNVEVVNGQAFRFTEKRKFYEKPVVLIGTGFTLGVAAVVAIITTL